MADQTIATVRAYGPRTFEEARLVHQRICALTSRALAATTRQEIEETVRELHRWLSWLECAREQFEIERLRLEITATPIMVLEDELRADGVDVDGFKARLLERIRIAKGGAP